MNFKHLEREAIVLPSRLVCSQEVCCKIQRGSIYVLISIFIAGRGTKWHGRILSSWLSYGLSISKASKFVHHKLAGRGDQRREDEFWYRRSVLRDSSVSKTIISQKIIHNCVYKPIFSYTMLLVHLRKHCGPFMGTYFWEQPVTCLEKYFFEELSVSQICEILLVNREQSKVFTAILFVFLCSACFYVSSIVLNLSIERNLTLHYRESQGFFNCEIGSTQIVNMNIITSYSVTLYR